MKWNISSIVELHFDVFDIEADSEEEAIEIFKKTVSDNHNLDVDGYGEFQPSDVSFDEINAWEDFDEY